MDFKDKVVVITGGSQDNGADRLRHADRRRLRRRTQGYRKVSSR